MRISCPALVLSVVIAACGSDNRTFDGGPGDDARSDGGLVCQGAEQNCGGACVDITSDPRSCGACGTACTPGDLCCEGRCVKSASCAFAVLTVSPLRGNQSGGDYLTLKGSGFTPGMSLFIGDGRAPVLVIDAKTARAQTPPGTVGTYDITIANAQGSSTTRKAFDYIAGGVKLPWQKEPLQVVRAEIPGIAVMQDGRVLVAGGTTKPDFPDQGLNTAEIFTRGTGTNPNKVTPAKNAMSIKRWRNAAVTTLDGRVLVAGGSYCTMENCKLADLFDPATDTFAPAPTPMNEARGGSVYSSVRGVLMVDGRVMITSSDSMTSEIYDINANTFSTAPLVSIHRFGHQLLRLRDGRVMLLGGDGCGSGPCGASAQKEVEVFDIATNKWTAVAPLIVGRAMFTAHTLPDGRVMVFGGASISAGGVNAPLDSIEAFDPAQGVWTAMTYKLGVGRTWHASALVRDGTVLVMGGYTLQGSCAPTPTVDQVDPVKGTVVSFGMLPTPNTEWSAVTMLDGSVLGVGGGACGGMALPDLDFLPGETLPN